MYLFRMFMYLFRYVHVFNPIYSDMFMYLFRYVHVFIPICSSIYSDMFMYLIQFIPICSCIYSDMFMYLIRYSPIRSVMFCTWGTKMHKKCPVYLCVINIQRTILHFELIHILYIIFN